MGIFDFLHRKANNDSAADLVNQWEIEAAKLQAYDKDWEREFSSLSEDRDKASKLEKEGDLFGAIVEYEQCLNKCMSSSKFNICNFAYDINRLAILYRKTKQIDKEIDLLTEMINQFNDYEDVVKWEIRLCKANSLLSPVKIVLPKAPISLPRKKEYSIGNQYWDTIELLPEFDFYTNKPDDVSTDEYLWKNPHLIGIKNKHKQKLFILRDTFKKMLSDADILEKQGELEDASLIYETMITEDSFMTNPYERLIIIYSKAKLEKEVIRILNEGINFFSNLRNRQIGYVISLAKKNNKLSFCEEKILNKEKIFYYGGAFELYNPYIIVEKWESKLNKIRENNK